MHAAALTLMEEALCRVSWPHAKLLDVGSYDINGSFRQMVEKREWDYTGLDVRFGPNVDHVVAQPFCWDIPDGEYHAVICGNMLHNTEQPWKLIPEMVRVLRPGGLLVVLSVTWNRAPSGRHPIDAWRFMEDGLRTLFDLTGQLEDYVIEYGGDADILGSAFKVKG